MKRSLKVAGLVVLVLVVGAAGFAGYIKSSMPTAGAARIEAGPGVVGVLSEYSYVWIVKSDRGALLIDAGVARDGAAVIAELKAMGLGPADVHTVLLTHGHHDHWLGLGAFPSARVLVGRGDAAYLRYEKIKPPQLFMERFVPPQKIEELEPDAALTLDGVDVKTVSIPGHTAGSTAYLIRGVLFTGDSLMWRKDRLQMGPPLFSDDVAQNLRSLARLEGLEATAVADGHAGLTADPGPKLHQLLVEAK